MSELNNDVNSSEEVYIPAGGKRATRAWSVAALVLSILSLLCCCFNWLGLGLGILAIIFSVVSRKSLGYFDGLAVAALVVGIIGTVFGLSLVIMTPIIENSEFYKQFLEELEKME